MAAVVHSKSGEQDSFVPQFGMVPVPAEFREFLHQAYGIEPHVKAYFNHQEPNRIYSIVHGKLSYIDVSAINPKSSRTTEKREFVPSGSDRTQIRLSKSTWQTLTDVEREELQKERRKKKAYKTSLCRTFRETKKCEYGEACIFAHGEEELRLPPKTHPKYKTQLCNKFIKWNYCPYGARCQFIHERLDENAGSTDVIKMGDSESVKNNFSHMDNFDVEQTNRSIKCMSASVTLGKHLPFVEQAGFCHSLATTGFNRAGNMGRFTEAIANQNIANIACVDQSVDDAGLIANNSILNQLIPIDNDTVLERLSERLNNMKMMGNGYMFSQSSFSKSDSNGDK